MISVAICDDEQRERDYLSELLGGYEKAHLQVECYESDEALLYVSEPVEKELEFHTKEGILRLKPSQITDFEYLNREVILHGENATYHLKKKITQVAQEMVPYHFASPHKSFVVNLYAVQGIKGYEIHLTDGRIVPLSQKKSVEFRRSLNEYLVKRT